MSRAARRDEASVRAQVAGRPSAGQPRGRPVRVGSRCCTSRGARHEPGDQRGKPRSARPGRCWSTAGDPERRLPVARPVPAVHGGDLPRLGSHDEDEHPARVRARRAAADRRAPTRTTGSCCMTASSAATTGTWYCCSSMVSAGGDGGAVGDAVSATRPDSPRGMLRGQLWWAIVHDMARPGPAAGRARRRLPHAVRGNRGGRPTALRNSDGLTPAELAKLSGYPELAGWLVSRGAAPAGARTRVNSLIAAVLAGDRGQTATRLRAFAPEGTRAGGPGLMAWAASGCKLDAIAPAGRARLRREPPRGPPRHPASSSNGSPRCTRRAQTGDAEMGAAAAGAGRRPETSGANGGATPLDSGPGRHGQEGRRRAARAPDRYGYGPVTVIRVAALKLHDADGRRPTPTIAGTPMQQARLEPRPGVSRNLRALGDWP